jgi:hypothetical protein
MSQWYYQKADGLPAGPYSDEQLREHREIGTVRDTTLVWRTGWGEWTTFADIWKMGAEPAATTSNADSPPALPFRLANTIVEAAPVAATYAKCSVCREEWPENLLFRAGRIRMCAKCLKAREDRRQRKDDGNSSVFGTDAGTASWLVKLLLIGLAVAGIFIFSLSYLSRFGK